MQTYVRECCLYDGGLVVDTGKPQSSPAPYVSKDGRVGAYGRTNAEAIFWARRYSRYLCQLEITTWAEYSSRYLVLLDEESPRSTAESEVIERAEY